MRRIGSLLLVVLSLAACAEEDRPPAASGVAGPGSTPAPPPSASDAGSIANPAFCEGLAVGGEPVVEVERVGRASETVGGVVKPGTYDLVQVSTYVDANPDCAAAPPGDCAKLRATGRVSRATVIVEAFAMRRVEEAGVMQGDTPALDRATARAFVYEPRGSAMATTELCPSADAKADVAYSASGSALTLVVDNREELFVLRP